MNTEPLTERYLTTKEITDWLHFNKFTVYSLIENDGLPCYRIGNRYRFKPSEVQEWLNAHKAHRSEEGGENGGL